MRSVVVPVAAQAARSRPKPSSSSSASSQRTISAGHTSGSSRIAQHEQRDLVEARMRIALGQQTRKRAQRREAGERERILHRLGRIALAQLHRDMAEVLGKPRLPHRVDVIARLQDGPQLARAPAVDEAEVASVLAREQLGDGRRLAVRLDGQDHALIRPLHQATAASFFGDFKAHLPVALGIVLPARAHLDEQEEMHRALEDLRQLAPRLRWRSA